MQAVTRHILTIGQELTFAKERVALLDEAPRANGLGTPQPVRSLNLPQQLSSTKPNLQLSTKGRDSIIYLLLSMCSLVVNGMVTRNARWTSGACSGLKGIRPE